jgi:hypothetical protein
MKKIIIMLAVLISFFGKMTAQTTAKGAPAPKKETYINDEERARMKKIREEGRIEKEAIMNDKSLTEQQRNVKLRELKKKQDAARVEVIGKERAESVKGNRKNFHSKKKGNAKAKPKTGAKPEREPKQDNN